MLREDWVNELVSMSVLTIYKYDKGSIGNLSESEVDAMISNILGEK